MLVLSTRATEGMIRSTGTVMWQGVGVKTYPHVTGIGGGRTLQGAWSDPFDASNNRLCSFIATGLVAHGAAWGRAPLGSLLLHKW